MPSKPKRSSQVHIQDDIKDDMGIGMLIDAAERSSTQAASLRDEVVALDKKLDLTNRVLRRLRVLSFVLIGCLLLLLILGLSNRAIFTEQKKTTHTIESCTSPNGKCYQDGQHRTAAAVSSIVDGNHNGVSDTKEILDAIKARP